MTPRSGKPRLAEMPAPERYRASNPAFLASSAASALCVPGMRSSPGRFHNSAKRSPGGGDALGWSVSHAMCLFSRLFRVVSVAPRVAPPGRRLPWSSGSRRHIGMRRCLETRHDRLMRESNVDYWKAKVGS